MGGMPLHSAVVHVPLGVAMLAPLLALWALVGAWRGAGASRWGVIAFLQVVIVAGGFYAMSLGKQEEERVERLVPKHAIEVHEEAGERFVWSGVVALVLSVVTFSVERRLVRWIALAAFAATLVTAGLAMRAGLLGGELVFRHGAASAYAKTPADTIRGRGGEHREHDDD